MIYLDYAANTPVAIEVLERFCQVESNFIGNPNASHQCGKASKEEMAKVTEGIARLLKVSPTEIIYISGASEGNNLAIKGIAHASKQIGRHIISTPLEHASVSGCLSVLKEEGFEVDLVSVKEDGAIDLNHLKSLMRNDTILVAICAVDSELGSKQPISKIKKILKDYPSCHLHVDATQAIGKVQISFEGVDTMCFTSHKFYGLNGCGILLKRKNLEIEPLIHGGASITRYRSGTPTLALAAAIEVALGLALKEEKARNEVVKVYNHILRERLKAYPNVCINSPEHGVPHILNLSIGGVKGTVFQRILDEKGICVSVRSACSMDGEFSGAIFAVCQDRRRALSSWRISLSHLTTEKEIQKFIEVFDLCYHGLVRK